MFTKVPYWFFLSFFSPNGSQFDYNIILEVFSDLIIFECNRGPPKRSARVNLLSDGTTCNYSPQHLRLCARKGFMRSPGCYQERLVREPKIDLFWLPCFVPAQLFFFFFIIAVPSFLCLSVLPGSFASLLSSRAWLFRVLPRHRRLRPPCHGETLVHSSERKPVFPVCMLCIGLDCHDLSSLDWFERRRNGDHKPVCITRCSSH